MAIKIYSHNNGEGSQLLAEAMGVKRLRHGGSRYVPRAGDYVINWGHSGPLDYRPARVINQPRFIGNVTNKAAFFGALPVVGEKPFNVPPYFFNSASALAWLREREGRTLVARTILAGHEGRGIVLIEKPEDMVDARLYTGYVKKKAEYRVHVVNGSVIDEVQKKRIRGHEGGDQRIRNTANGYVFARTDVVVPQTVRDNAVSAVRFFRLDFGAVDVIYNESEAKAYVLEINTAPGIQGTTVEKYKAAFQGWLR